ncbi:induced myeloid leukemia cell differentiation protein Mcl-1 homolog [Esox lucius]|uniref:induced myeloid leukemia cell differentiation protein Mcl-1 homolog n=1 Tax=Esox lucius TaxID=8010 RepID=UPI001476D2B5|nr:induced myeloid leukemia cell differentiation protein Mcl-1 homolog [Esox lucius]
MRVFSKSKMSLISQGTGECVDECRNRASLDTETRQLVKSFLGDFTEHLKPRWNESKALSTMKQVVTKSLDKHRYSYNGMLYRLSLGDSPGDYVRFVSVIANRLFADGTTNWGRVVSLLAFGTVVCRYLKDKGKDNCVEAVGQEISMYLLTDQRDWLVKNNSWDGFVEFFRVAEESTLRNVLLTFAGFGAALAMLKMYVVTGKNLYM